MQANKFELFGDITMTAQNITPSQKNQIRAAEFNRRRHVFVAAPAVPMYATPRHAYATSIDDMRYDALFAAMTDGAEYLSAMGRPSAW